MTAAQFIPGGNGNTFQKTYGNLINDANNIITSSESEGKISLDVTSVNSLVSERYDYIGVTYPTGTSEVYTFRYGGVAGTIVATVTVVYTTATKELLSSVTKT